MYLLEFDNHFLLAAILEGGDESIIGGRDLVCVPIEMPFVRHGSEGACINQIIIGAFPHLESRWCSGEGILAIATCREFYRDIATPLNRSERNVASAAYAVDRRKESIELQGMAQRREGATRLIPIRVHSRSSHRCRYARR